MSEWALQILEEMRQDELQPSVITCFARINPLKVKDVENEFHFDKRLRIHPEVCDAHLHRTEARVLRPLLLAKQRLQRAWEELLQ